MKRLLLILTIASVALCQTVHAQYYSVNYDTRTVAAMVAAFGTEAVAEGYYREQVDDILKHYTAAEVATAGIFAAKFLEHKALSDLGIWNSRTENYFYLFGCCVLYALRIGFYALQLLKHQLYHLLP